MMQKKLAEEFAKLTENDLSIPKNTVKLNREQYFDFANDNLANLYDSRVKSNGVLEQ